MRRLVWFTLGFGLSCGLWAYDQPLPSWILLSLTGLICAVPGRRWRIFRCGALLCLGCLLGIFWCKWFTQDYLSAPLALHNTRQTAVIRITDASYETDYGIAADGVVTWKGKPYLVRLYLDEGGPLSPGDRVRGEFRITTRAGADTYYGGKGIFLLAYLEEGEIIPAGGSDWRDFPARLRIRLLEILHTCFPADTEPFAQALLLGQTRGLDYETDTALKISGIRHVVAVSGLHVSILFALLGTLALHNRYAMALLGFPALLLFAAVAGFTPSVTRACMMSALMLLAMLTDRQYDGPTALAFAVLVMLICNPLVITSVSFQLSAASVAGIFLFTRSIYDWMTDRLKQYRGFRKTAGRNLSISVSMSLGAMSLTVPLCAVHFGAVSLIGVVTNLLTLWLISTIFYGCMGVCLLSLIWTRGAVLLAKLISLPIRFILLTAKLLSRIPLAAVYTASPYITAWLVFVYLLLAVFLLERKKRPGLLLCCGTLTLCLALTASYLEPRLDDVRMTVLDVGQGQCILLQSGGRTFMVDCGGGNDRLAADLAAENLLSQGIFRLDGLILTHTDRDHAGGVENLLSRVETSLLILPPIPGERVQSGSGQILYAKEDLEIAYDDVRITVYPPKYPGTGNENSLCVLFESEKCDILITGDRDGFGERSLLRNARIPDVDILIAGHHGSRYSTCEALLESVKPEIVCISAGRDNPYGHPAPELLERLEQFGCNIYRTDRDGTILIRR